MTAANRKLLAVALACVLVGWYAGSVGMTNPLIPSQPRRPLLAFLSKVAKTGLWIMLAAEQPPAQSPDHNHYVVRRNDDPHSVCHAEGW